MHPEIEQLVRDVEQIVQRIRLLLYGPTEPQQETELSCACNNFAKFECCYHVHYDKFKEIWENRAISTG